MTQLTFFSFDLQAFLFLIFHRSPVALIGHAIFMTSENVFILAALRPIVIASTPLGHVNGAVIYALVLLAWYGGVAFRARLRAWFALTVPIVVLLYVASGPVEALARGSLDRSPAWGALVSALLVALSHSAEPLLPPRTVDPWRWTSLRGYILGPDVSLARRAARLGHLAGIVVLGTVAESWASIRLMPYNWLMAMMRLGYARDRSVEIRTWAARAWASGNPALDFVGTGGGTFLALGDERIARSSVASIAGLRE